MCVMELSKTFYILFHFRACDKTHDVEGPFYMRNLMQTRYRGQAW